MSWRSRSREASREASDARGVVRGLPVASVHDASTLAAWLIGSTRDTTAQILLIALATAPIAALGFKHSIAGATEAFYRASIGAAGWAEMLGGWIVPAVLGNIVGGVLLVATTSHQQTSGPA